jgi:REP element-mobilizing transposase RayT
LSDTDHVHLLVAHPRTSSPAELVEAIKVASSKWIKTKLRNASAFHWQGGYGAFSISPTDREALEDYIANQREHHRRVTFQEEYRGFLKSYGVEFDER